MLEQSTTAIASDARISSTRAQQSVDRLCRKDSPIFAKTTTSSLERASRPTGDVPRLTIRVHDTQRGSRTVSCESGIFADRIGEKTLLSEKAAVTSSRHGSSPFDSVSNRPLVRRRSRSHDQGRALFGPRTYLRNVGVRWLLILAAHGPSAVW